MVEPIHASPHPGHGRERPSCLGGNPAAVHDANAAGHAVRKAIEEGAVPAPPAAAGRLQSGDGPSSPDRPRRQAAALGPTADLNWTSVLNSGDGNPAREDGIRTDTRHRGERPEGTRRKRAVATIVIMAVLLTEEAARGAQPEALWLSIGEMGPPAERVPLVARTRWGARVDRPGMLRLSLDDTRLPAGEGERRDRPQVLRLSLDEAVRLALERNRDLANARLARVVQRYGLRVAENEFRPRMRFGYGVDRTGSKERAPTDAGTLSSNVSLKVPTGGQFAVSWTGNATGENADAPYSGGVNLTFTQPLLRGAGRRVATAGLESAYRDEERNLMAFRDTLATLVDAVARLYRAYGQAERQLDIARRGLERARERHEANRLYVETGRMAPQDLVQNESEITQREIALVAARNALDSARLDLVGTLDVESGTRFQLTDELHAGNVPEPVDTSESLERALANRTDHREALIGREEARINVELAQDARKWDLSLALGVNLAGAGAGLADTAYGLDPGDYSVGLRLDVPIGRAAADPGRFQHLSAVVALEATQNQYRELRHAIEVEVLNAVRAVEVQYRQMTLARNARKLAEQAVEIERIKLASGLSTNFQVVALEDDLIASQSQEIDTVVAYLNTVAELDQTLGTTLERWGIDVEAVDSQIRSPVPAGIPEIPNL